MNGKSILLDSCTIIYLQKGLIQLGDFSDTDSDFFISDISYMECLGYIFPNENEKEAMVSMLNLFHRIPISESVISATISLKQQKRIKLPDAIIFATALHFKLTLVTANISDFQDFSNLINLVNPLRSI